jgi:molybdopterin molybdotransferase
METSALASVADVVALLDAKVTARASTSVPLEQTLGCVLAQDVFADCDQPAFDRSAIDGFAVLAGTSSGEFVVAGEILPGDAAPAAPAPGEAWRVFTGSAIPPGCGLVMQEEAVLSGGRVTLAGAASEALIRRQGSTARQGDRLLPANDRVGSGELTVLASVGAIRPRVIPRPRVLHLTTGREVVPTGARPGPGQIRNTNGPLLHALIATAGATSLPAHHVDESVAALAQAVQAADAFDLLLVSGGSSVGEHDRTAPALAALGFETLIHRVNVRPGKPLLVARRGEQWAFGLPGNPVSHFATFHVFIARAIRRMRGLPPAPWLRVPLKAGAPLIATPRETFWPAQLSADGVRARPWLDSGDLVALAGINALIRLPGNRAPRIGEDVEVIACPEPN